ncbi:hypothetical protein [Brevundimonas sp.]|uniref:hypothetical protein n=1 Tax=Brevundimonas sp. TaxID=1871086 RepID=UPI003BAA858E
MISAPISGLSTMATPTAGSPSDATRARHEARIKSALTALETLKRPQTDAAEERKAAAQKKIEDLKARIRALRMSGGDPEATARMAAQLARELGSAVKAYAAAGGTSGGGTSSGAGVGAASPVVASGSETAGAGAEGAAMTPPDGESPQSLSSTEGDDETPPGDVQTPKDPYRQVIERQQAQAAERARESADKEADRKFATEAKALAAELKAILRQAAEAAKREGNTTVSSDEQTADKAMADVDAALADLSAPMGGIGVSLQV